MKLIPWQKKVISSEPPNAIIITMTSSNDQSIRRPRNWGQVHLSHKYYLFFVKGEFLDWLTHSQTSKKVGEHTQSISIILTISCTMCQNHWNYFQFLQSFLARLKKQLYGDLGENLLMQPQYIWNRKSKNMANIDALHFVIL